jgi:hypothetical protein
MRDFRCAGCGRQWEEIRTASSRDPKCCGKRAIRIWRGAPSLAIATAGYNKALGAHVSGARDLSRQMTRKNRWIPNKREIEEVLHTPVEEHYGARIDREKVKAIARKKASELHGIGRYPRPC